MITLKFQVPQGNGYTMTTIRGRVLPHLQDFGNGWVLLDSEQEKEFEIQTAKTLSGVELQVTSLVLERHYGFNVKQIIYDNE